MEGHGETLPLAKTLSSLGIWLDQRGRGKALERDRKKETERERKRWREEVGQRRMHVLFTRQ
jgi:hypothetical protein